MKIKKLNINEAKDFLINIIQETYVFLKPRVKKDISLLVGMGSRNEDHERLIVDMEKRIKDVLKQSKLNTSDCIALMGLSIYNFYDFRYISHWRSWFKFICATDYEKSKFVQCLYGNISEEEIRELLIKVLINSGKMFYAYNLDKEFYNEEIREEEDKESKYLYQKIHEDDFKNFFEKL
jgi:hypothetical protein